jgi:hypothetical protein
MNDERATSAVGDETTARDRPQPPQEVVDPRDDDPLPPEPNIEISGARDLRDPGEMA